MKVIAIVNPISGRQDTAALVSTVAAELAREGCELVVRRTTQSGDAERFAADVTDDVRAVLVVGGDGTVSGVAAGLAGRDIPLTILPSGTENIVARHFSMSADPLRLVETILHGRTIAHDVGVYNGRHFIIVCGIGFDASVVERVTHARTGHISYLTYVGPLWRTFWTDSFPRLSVSIDGEPVFDGRGLVLAGVQPRYSLGLRILAHAVHDDGYLDVCVLPCSSRRSLLGHAYRAARRFHDPAGGAIYRKCRQVSITSPQRVPVQCDGDLMGVLPARLEVIPAGLQLLVSP
ncbi:MAG: diacylglycerol kinase family lipid kinase [bacterium]|nr:diacylglycerol kinase family lipid kinase [bacterium]